jgi:hypothetical protein
MITCEYDDGSPIQEDITGATVEFHMMTGLGVVLIANGAGTIVDAAAKQVGYQWQPGDTDTASSEAIPHQAEFEVTLTNGLVMTFPNASNILVHIYPDIS